MMRDERIDSYIDKSAEFAQPILSHLRELVHKAVPDVQETMKWSFPNFVYKKSILCAMASFKNHCSFGFWLMSKMEDPDKVFKREEAGGMGSFGKMTSPADLPSDEIIIRYIIEATMLIDQGVKVDKKPVQKDSKELIVPLELEDALKNNPKAMATFERFSPSHRKEYILWITEAKTEATRLKRLETTIEWLTEGKSRNWKYEKC